MNEYVYRFALEGESWTYSNSQLANVLTRVQRMSRTVPTRAVIIQRVKITNPEDCFLVKKGLIRKEEGEGKWMI